MTTPHSNLPALLVAGAVLAFALLSESAQAIPISGSIGFNGNATMSQVGGPSGTSTLTFNGPLTVDIRTADYRGIPAATTTSFAPITWTGSGTSAVLTSINSPEWTITVAGTTYQYSILSLTSATIGVYNGQPAVSMQGSGVATISGAINRDPTFSTFSIQGLGNLVTFEIIQSSTGPPRRTPEAGSAMTLLGLAVVALEVLRRTRPALR